MKARDIILQLMDKLPVLTDQFTDNFSITSITSVGTVATLTTSAAHGQNVTSLININGVQTPLNILTLTRTGTTLFIETVDDHDLTNNFKDTVEIIGANESEFNGTFNFINASNRRNFTLSTTDSGATVGTGSMQAIDVSFVQYNGFFEVQSVDTPTTLTYNLAGPISESAISGGILSGNFRISGAIDPTRAVNSYTKQSLTDDWCFVALGNVTASKDRNTQNDAITVYTGSDQLKQMLIQNFSIFVIVNTTASLSARNHRDDMEDTAVFLFKSLVGTNFNTGLTESGQYRTVFNSHNIFSYDTAVYVHQFAFETVADLTFGDSVGYPEDAAFRDINFDISTQLMSDDTIHLTGSIDLDDTPL